MSEQPLCGCGLNVNFLVGFQEKCITNYVKHGIPVIFVMLILFSISFQIVAVFLSKLLFT